MHVEKETKWLCENAKNLEKFSGQWILFSAHEGLVSKGPSLDAVLKSTPLKRRLAKSFVFHVPAKEELIAPPLSISLHQVSR